MRRKYIYIYGVLGGLLLAGAAWGAVPQKLAQDKKLNQYVTQGVFIGGKAGDGFSLLNVRRLYSPASKVERIFLDLGDRRGRPLKNAISYFNVSLEKEPRRIVIDLAQVQTSGVDQIQLKKILARSQYIEKPDIHFDPEDLSTVIVLPLKKNVKLEVFKMPSATKPGRIVLDLAVSK